MATLGLKIGDRVIIDAASSKPKVHVRVYLRGTVLVTPHASSTCLPLHTHAHKNCLLTEFHPEIFLRGGQN